MARKATTRKDTRKAPKNNEFFNGLLTGLKEVAAHRSGEITLPSRYVDVPPRVDVKAIRTRLKLSQSEFADRFYFPIRTLQDWELGRNQPLSPISRNQTEGSCTLREAISPPTPRARRGESLKPPNRTASAPSAPTRYTIHTRRE